jgi:hypothetical protein
MGVMAQASNATVSGNTTTTTGNGTTTGKPKTSDADVFTAGVLPILLSGMVALL